MGGEGRLGEGETLSPSLNSGLCTSLCPSITENGCRLPTNSTCLCVFESKYDKNEVIRCTLKDNYSLSDLVHILISKLLTSLVRNAPTCHGSRL